MNKRILIRTSLAVFSIAACGIVAWERYGPNPDALWQIVSKQCLPEEKSGASLNRCEKVDLAAGYVVFKDRKGIGQYLLIPSERVSGIESSKLTQPASPNYWLDAWNARGYVEKAVKTKLAIEDIGLAINSAHGRGQDQLHIHIDCVQPEVIAALKAQRDTIGEHWSALAEPLSGHRYRARLIDESTLDHTDPFKILADDIRLRGELMANQTLFLTGTILSNGKPGFILLNDHVQPHDNASAEELLDHSCRIRQSRGGRANSVSTSRRPFSTPA